VPAYRGGRVAYDGDPVRGRQYGRITGFPGPHIRVKLDGRREAIITHPVWKIEYLPRAVWMLTRENVYRLWDRDIISVPCKPHCRMCEPREIRPGWMDSTECDGLTIHAHYDRPWQVAYFGDTITLDADGRTYTVHHNNQQEGEES
jgi:hypothetical protein